MDAKKRRRPRADVLLFAPEPVRDRLRDAHPRPLVGVRRRNGRFWSGRVSPRLAWTFPYIQIENAGSNFAALVFDCDHPKALGNLADLPLYSWLVRNNMSGHAHVTWTLALPVHRYPSASRWPLDYLKSISEFLHTELDADPGYSHTLAANPAAPPEGRSTFWGSNRPYTLHDLAAVIPFNWEPPRASQTGIGRNVDLFRDLMAWAGRRVNARLSVLAAAQVRNQEFAYPLSVAEVAGIARHVERYRARWAVRGWHAKLFIGRQRARAKKQTGRAMKASASSFGSNEALRPWEAEGISRASWYRRRQHMIPLHVVVFSLPEFHATAVLQTRRATGE